MRKAAPIDRQPNPEAVHRIAAEIADLLTLLVRAYQREHEVGWPPGGAGLGVQNGQSDATLAAFESPEARASRSQCRHVAYTVTKVRKMLRGSVIALTTGEIQPTRPARNAVIGRQEFDQTLHEQRERDLRQ